MDSNFMVRIAIALVIAAALAVQSRGLAGQPHRRRAFQLGAAALLFFALFNFLISRGGELSGLEQASALAGVGLFAAAIVSLGLSLRSGERRADLQRVRDASRSYVAERAQAAEQQRDEQR